MPRLGPNSAPPLLELPNHLTSRTPKKCAALRRPRSSWLLQKSRILSYISRCKLVKSFKITLPSKTPRHTWTESQMKRKRQPFSVSVGHASPLICGARVESKFRTCSFNGGRHSATNGPVDLGQSPQAALLTGKRSGEAIMMASQEILFSRHGTQGVRGIL